MINLKLEVNNKNAKNIYDSIADDLYEKGRADLKIISEKEKLIFEINSEDYTSIRATINSILLKLRAFDDLDKKIKDI
jgi:tRNA threonylcarbamoyladenosine modification (KEOPS) complex  Pcc1 subunit